MTDSSHEKPRGLHPPSGFFWVLKRLIDVGASLLLLLVLWPLMVIVAIATALAMGRPVLFRQRRPGLNERPFTLLKFRSMREACDANGWPLPDAERMTWLGGLLRKTSLDELPQLWNVLWGEMSLVGPRPLLMEYLGRYSEKHSRRHLVRPGITGLAQVNGRQDLRFSERLDLDVWYVDHWSLGLDLKILVRTIWSVLGTRGTTSTGDWSELDDVGIFPEEWAQRPRGTVGDAKAVAGKFPATQHESLDLPAAGHPHGSTFPS